MAGISTNDVRYAPPADYRHLSLSAPAEKLPSINKYMEDHWHDVFPNRKFAKSVYRS
ncbi:MAG: hypothetical protein WDO15_02085 [Bacteroidota bacterium]